MSGDDPMTSLSLELMTASLGGDTEAYLSYVKERLDEVLTTQDDAYDLVSRLAAFAGLAVKAWAEDTDRDASEVLQLIALDAAQE